VRILLWGLPAERPLERVHAELERLGASTLVLDQHAVLETEVDLVVGSEVSGSIRVRDQRIDLRTVTAAYLRPYDSRRLPRSSRLVRSATLLRSRKRYIPGPRSHRRSS